jgi:DNA topoisomerase-1
MNVVIVESPAKAKTINRYLGSGFNVLASYGHIRDLPSKDGSVNPDDDFAMSWDMDAKSAKRINEIAKAVKSADRLILATDPDREGEAISWHVLQALEQKNALKDVAVERVVFNAITKRAVLEAMANPRDLDRPLIDAYLARRALDYLVGFTLSPVLWRKLPGAKSAGRVQSVALRLVCDRELEIEAFKSEEYWSIEAALKTASNEPFTAKLHSIDGQKLDKFDIPDQAVASTIETALDNVRYQVELVESKPHRRNPYAPFTTSTLQQEASRKLGFSSSRTMQVAQRLYEGIQIDGDVTGLITYMRTDGVQITPEAIADCRNVIAQNFGEPYVPSSPRIYKTKAKNAQEAHEAIRPTRLSRLPKDISGFLDDDQRRLYDLIWKRTIASQMEHARLERTTATILTQGQDGKHYRFRASGSVIRFDGFLKLYQEGMDDGKGEDDARRLPAMAKGDMVGLEKLSANQHFTEPPPRYTEATLIKKMEELGIGRPSTYTSTLSVLREREYVRLRRKRLVPEDKGRLVTAFLESFFARYVQFDFTANLEQKLDRISAGEIAWKDVLREFWREFIAAVDDIADLRVSQVLDALNELLGPHIFPAGENGKDQRACPSCEDGQLSLKVGRYGAFVGCSNYPDCRFTRQISAVNGEEQPAENGTRSLGLDPETGLEVTLRTGRFGPYVQLGEAAEGEKPKRTGLPKGLSTADVDLDRALSLLSLPRAVGAHPETGKEISAGLGRYGPFVLHDGVYANLEDWEEIFNIGLNRAVTLLAEKAAKTGGRRAGALKDLGEHPEQGGKIQVMDGRYGPYIKHGKINATLPRNVDPDDVTVDLAIALIAEKAAKGKTKRKSGKARKQASRAD